MSKFPTNIFVDTLTPDGSSGLTLDKVSVISNVHSLNSLRNSKLDNPIPISAESPFLQAGNFLCIKIVDPKTNLLSLMFIDVVKNPHEYSEIIKTVSESDRYLLGLIKEYIENNYEEVSKEIKLVKGFAVATDSKIKTSISPRSLLNDPNHRKAYAMFPEWINKVLLDINFDLIRNGVIIEYQADKGDDSGFKIAILTDDASLKLSIFNLIKKALPNATIL